MEEKYYIDDALKNINNLIEKLSKGYFREFSDYNPKTDWSKETELNDHTREKDNDYIFGENKKLSSTTKKVKKNTTNKKNYKCFKQVSLNNMKKKTNNTIVKNKSSKFVPEILKNKINTALSISDNFKNNSKKNELNIEVFDDKIILSGKINSKKRKKELENLILEDENFKIIENNLETIN